MCLANTADNGYQIHNDADEELQRSIAVQQLGDVVDGADVHGAVLPRVPRNPSTAAVDLVFSDDITKF